MNSDTFWMVWNQARDVPRVKHDSEESAIREAERLARLSPGESFYVLQATHLRIKDDMKRVRLSVAEFVPF